PVPAHSEVFQHMFKGECHFRNGTEKATYVESLIYNRVDFLKFDSDVGDYVGFTPWGERNARYWNNLPEWMESRRALVDTACRRNYGVFAPFLVVR
ncbi:HB2J protein, partial [Malurus elegans]|nr:HB2J protein [Malurus elegans]